jgi:hypothetical protein
MAKKQTFLDKARKKDAKQREFVKLVKAYRADNGAWKFRTNMVEITDQNRNEIYK